MTKQMTIVVIDSLRIKLDFKGARVAVRACYTCSRLGVGGGGGAWWGHVGGISSVLALSFTFYLIFFNFSLSSQLPSLLSVSFCCTCFSMGDLGVQVSVHTSVRSLVFPSTFTPGVL